VQLYVLLRRLQAAKFQQQGPLVQLFLGPEQVDHKRLQLLPLALQLLALLLLLQLPQRLLMQLPCRQQQLLLLLLALHC
jgi:hypothetical protein